MNDGAGASPRRVAWLLAQVGGWAGMRFAERVAALGLTPAHTGLLRAVNASPGRSQQAIADHLGVLPSRLVALVDSLERDGLMERRRNTRDRRHYALHLTPAGEARLAGVAEVAREHGEEVLAPLSDRDRASLARLLGKLAAHGGLAAGVHPGYRTLGPDPATAADRVAADEVADGSG